MSARVSHRLRKHTRKLRSTPTGSEEWTATMSVCAYNNFSGRGHCAKRRRYIKESRVLEENAATDTKDNSRGWTMNLDRGVASIYMMALHIRHAQNDLEGALGLGSFV